MFKYLLSIILILPIFIACRNSTKAEQNTIGNNEFILDNAAFSIKKDSALLFCKQKGLNTEFCILIDMSLHSGKNRLFIWNFGKDTLEHQALCAHGYGGGSTQEKPVFSNIEGSYCTSLGKYKVGARAYSQYGINVHYKLHGYEKTNNNAFKRWIVLHSHTPVSTKEIAPRHLPLGWSQGCPVTDNETMKLLDKKLQLSKKPVLLWVYN
jgi:hypothetical protein